MQFRWLTLIALWTCLCGPIFGSPGASSSPPPANPPVRAASPRTPHAWHSSTELHR